MRIFRLDDDHPLTGGHVLAIVALFFGAIIAVNGVMAWLATGSFPGMVVKNSYVASQQYNARLAAERTLAAQDIRAAVTTTDGYIHLELRDRTGRALTGLTVAGRAGRPAAAREDRSLMFAPYGSGYRSREPLGGGRWAVAVEAARDGNLVWRESRVVEVRTNPDIRTGDGND